MAGQIISRGKNTWLVRVYLGRDGEGSRKYQNKTIRGAKKDAQQWLNDALRKKDLGIPTFETKVTVEKYLSEWLEGIAKQRVSEKTYSGYASQLALVQKRFETVRLSHLRAEDIQKFYGTLTSSMARHVHAPLRSALSQAVKWQLIHANPCDAVERPRHQAREMQYLTKAEATRLIAVNDKYRVLFAFLIATGARPSEALGLKWTDIDLDKPSVTIQRTLQWHKGEGKGHYFSEPKTKRSRRAVPLPASLVQQLREHRRTQAEALLKQGIRSELVFSNTEGSPILLRNLERRHFKPALVKAGIPVEFTLYGLRHTCATLLLQAGTHPKVVAERLGHSSTTLTMDVYSHVAPGMQSEATAQLETMLYG